MSFNVFIYLYMFSHHSAQVEKELKSICNDILDVLDKHLIPAANTGESKVFYYKMCVNYTDQSVSLPFGA